MTSRSNSLSRRPLDHRVTVTRQLATVVHFDLDTPDEVRDAVLPFLQAHVWRLPHWVTELVVCYAPDDRPDTGASNDEAPTSLTIESLAEYRYARLTVGAVFLKKDADTRDELVRHEFSHTHVDPLWDFALHLLKTIYQDEDESAYKVMREQLRRVGEGCVEDLRMAFDRATEATYR